MKKFQQLILVCLAIICSFTGMAQNENYDAVYQDLSKTYTLNPDGSIDFAFHKIQKLQTYLAFHYLFGETFVVYNPGFQTLKINESYTIMADGKKILTPENAFNKVLPRFARNAPAFNQLREMVITHTGLEVGATIHLSYTLGTGRDFYPAMMGTEVMAETQPVDRYIVRVIVPNGQKLHYRLFNAALEPRIETDAKTTSYTWELKDVPARTSERDQTGPSGNYPTLVFSSLGGYDNLVGFLTGQPAFSDAQEPALQSLLENLKNETKTDSDLIFALQKEVVKNLNLFEHNISMVII